MKKILKIVGIIVAVPVLLLAAVLAALFFMPMAPLDYTEKTAAGGEIEGMYLKKGPHKVAMQKKTGSEVTKNFYVYYPTALKNTRQQYPVIVMLNGTGVLPKKYKAVFEHLASWGFVVIGNDDGSAGFGLSADETIALIRKENTDVNSLFYGKLDEASIGIVGHSQGGAGVLTAVSAMEHKDAYKAAAALSPTHEEMAHMLGWQYDLEQITLPILLLAGTAGDFETQAVIPPEKMAAMYEKIPTSEKIMARRIGAEHGQMLYVANGYVTAWFLWQLTGDVYAGAAFTENGEMASNPIYRDIKIQ